MIDDEVDTIAPDGDTILIVGAAKRKFRVSSKRLSEASSVFAALFGPHFREGQRDRSALDPVEIELPDDDWGSMRRIFNMLHGSASTEQGSTWWSGELLDFAVSVDRYDLVDALRFGISAIFSRWFRDRSTCPNIRVLGQIVAAAYLLEDKNAFRLGTKQIIQVSIDRVMDLDGEKCCNILPPFVLLALEEQRSMARHKITRELIGLDRFSKCWVCTTDDPELHQWPFQEKMRHELGLRYWPPPHDIPIQTIVSKIAEFRLRGRPVGCGHQDDYKTRRQLDATLQSVNLLGHGLCLTCVYEEKFSDATTCAGH